MNAVSARRAALRTIRRHADALTRRGYDDGHYVAEAADTLDHLSRPGNARICITTTLAATVGKLVEDQAGAVSVYYDDADPEQIWHVEIETHDGVGIHYVVDDESGTFERRPA